MKWDNIAAIGGAAIIAALVIFVQPEQGALAVASTLVGGCIGYLQRRGDQ